MIASTDIIRIFEFDMQDSDIIGKDRKCSQELREFFKGRLGKGFHFIVPFQDWLHSNPEKTLGDACRVYPEISRAARTARLPIWPQFKYNQFIREQFEMDPAMTFEKAVRLWNEQKESEDSRNI